jgi:hypothetical protein
MPSQRSLFEVGPQFNRRNLSAKVRALEARKILFALDNSRQKKAELVGQRSCSFFVFFLAYGLSLASCP